MAGKSKSFQENRNPKCWVLCVYHTWINAVSSYMVHKDMKTTFPIYYTTQCVYGRVMHSMAHVGIRRQLWVLVLPSTMYTQKSDSGHQAPLPTKPSPQPFQFMDTLCSVSPVSQPFSSPSSLSLCLPMDHSEYEKDADIDLYMHVHMYAVLSKHCLGTVIHRNYLVISRNINALSIGCCSVARD